ncbi:MAG: type II secretion system F family protein [candidate division Zixibacteria bacterium]|nr:type II secretion system F family protein [candidate division Zixibacteria bacterium]MDD5425380.1 type II secretion system F family protein [candidate division Zixibacteria bacterium]
MPVRYKYRAVAHDGKVHRGVITSQNSEAVEQILAQQNLYPVTIAPVKETKALSFFGFLKGVDYDKLISFTTSLSTLHKAGVPLLRALSIIKIGHENSRFNYALGQIKADIRSGKPLSEAMAEFSDLFSRVYIASVAAGEESGKLDYTLDEMADILEKEMEMNRQIKLAIRYPLIVITVIIAAFVIMMTYVIPRFVDFYSSFGAQLPAPTRLMIAVSNAVTNYWPLVLGLLVVFGFTFKKIISQEKGRLWFDRQLLSLPVFGQLIIKGNIARFAMMFKILFKSGLPIIKSLAILAATIKNTVIEQEINLLEDLFKKGREIKLPNPDFKYMPDMALHMMAIGLESGSLDEMLGEIGKHYAKEVGYTARQLVSIIEPILTLILGIFVLILALSIFLPMWNLIKVFQG